MANIERYNKHNSDRSLSLFDNFFDSMLSGWDNWNTRVPAVDVEENDKDYSIKAELPGFDEKNVKVTVQDNVLTLSGETDESKDEKDGKKYLMKERRHEAFERSFTLPENADAAAISAAFKDGLLTVTVPKTEKAESNRIEVKIN